MVTPGKNTIVENDQNMETPQADEMKVSSIEDYISSVSDLMKMLEFIVDSHLSDISTDNPYDFCKFNNALHANMHYCNISKLLKYFHGCTDDSLFVKKEKAVYFCRGDVDESNCKKTVFYKKLKEGTTPLCMECRKLRINDLKRNSRKRKAGAAWTEHDSKVNITILSPGSRKKRLRQNRYIKYNLQSKLKSAMATQPLIELDGENTNDEQLMKLIEGASRVSSDEYQKFRAMMIESLSENIQTKQKEEDSAMDNKQSITEFIDSASS
ncbi:predicted protein [Chaetoceros tenuissimus]|nr:predicted protein [Chaetoceros tenuissimus]